MHAGEFDHVPSYAELDTMVTNARKAKLEIFDVCPLETLKSLALFLFVVFFKR
jgi:hypothetical protein